MSNTIYAVNRCAAMMFQKNLYGSHGKAGRDYFTQRGLSDKTIKQFGLGYASGRGFPIRDFLKGQGFDDEELVASGLFDQGTDGKLWFRFSDRVMFPIKDLNGRILSFGGRILGTAEKGTPKYKNGPESEIYSKRNNLYAQEIAFRSGKDHVILCEGYMDVIAMHQAGFSNAVASLGTALTDVQADLIKSTFDKVIILYDTDGPGKNACQRAIPILESAKITPVIANSLPEKDPDEFIRKHGATAFKMKLDAAMPVLDYLCVEAKDDNGNIDFDKMLDILVKRYDETETPQTIMRLERSFG